MFLGGNDYYINTLFKWIKYVYLQLLEVGCIVIPVEVDGEVRIAINGRELGYFPENEGELLELLMRACRLAD